MSRNRHHCFDKICFPLSLNYLLNSNISKHHDSIWSAVARSNEPTTKYGTVRLRCHSSLCKITLACGVIHTSACSSGERAQIARIELQMQSHFASSMCTAENRLSFCDLVADMESDGARLLPQTPNWWKRSCSIFIPAWLNMISVRRSCNWTVQLCSRTVNVMECLGLLCALLILSRIRV